MTFQIVDKRNGEVIDLATEEERAFDLCDEWNLREPDIQPYFVRWVYEDGDRPVPTATA